MINLQLADLYDVYNLKKIKWDYTDFTKALEDETYLGYGIVNIDAGGLAFEVINKRNKTLSFYNDCTNVAIRPSMTYSYVKEFCEDVKRISDGILEVSFGEYPKSKIKEKVDSSKLEKTGRKYTVRQNNEFVELDELIDLNGNKMVFLKGNYYKVESLRWLVNEYRDTMITKDAINAGLAYERNLTNKELYESLLGDLYPRKYSNTEMVRSNIINNEPNLVIPFIKNVLANEIISEEMKLKIKNRDEELQRMIKEERLKEEEARRLRYEQERPERERRNLLNYYFPQDAISAIASLGFNEEEMVKVNLTIIEELDNIKYFIDDKEKLIEIIITLYKTKESRKRLAPYLKERYDDCREYLEQFDINYLNVVLKQTIGKDEYLDDYVKMICEAKGIQYKKK